MDETAARTRNPQPDAQLRFAASVVVAAIVVAGIYFGRPILVPLALAILFAFVLAPVVTWLRRLHLGHVTSVILTTLFAMAVVGVVVLFIGTQLARLAADLPHYQHNIADKIHSLQISATRNNLVGRTTSLFQNLGNQISAPPQILGSGAKNAAQTPGDHETPVPVEIRQPAATPIEIIENILRPLLNPLATAGIAVIFVVFILLQKEDLRDRFIWIAGSGDMQRAKLALDDGAHRVSRYLLTQTAINTVFGALIGTGLWFIGVPNPWLWGLAATILRFIPYVGVPLAASAPALLSLAVAPGWSKLLWTLGLYFTLEPITGQIVEPLLYGRSAGLSPAAVVIAATFWTWVWGPVGLLLSTPLTLCLAVLGRHVERLRFLDVLLGNRPPLAHEESFYLRVLAGDPDDAARLAEEFLKNHTLCEYYDIALKALVLAQADVDRGALETERSASVKEMIEGLIQNLADHEDVVLEGDGVELPAASIFTPETLPPDWAGQPVLCVAGRGMLDEAAALLLVHLLEKRGIGARVLSSNDVSPTNIQRLDPTGIRVFCLSYLQAGSGTNAHYLMRRLRRRIPAALAMACFWGLAENNSRVLDTIGTAECEVVTSFAEALDHILAAIAESRMPGTAPLAGAGKQIRVPEATA